MSQSPLLLGHRGTRVSLEVTENTLPAFDLALQHGCDGFEFDVRLTSCGEAVICHDPRHGGVLIEEAVHSELPELPLLDDVLARYGNRAFLDIELKMEGLEQKVLALLKEHPPQRPYVVSSFLRPVLMELRARSGSIPLGIICDSLQQLSGWRELPVEYVIPEYSLITPTLVNEVHAAGKLLLAWTVNEPTTMRMLSEWEVDGIISDDTRTLVRTIRINGNPP